MKTDFIPVAVTIHVALPLIAYLSVRNQKHDQQDHADVFRYAPGAAWFVLIGGLCIMAITAAIAWTAPAGKEVPLWMLGVLETAYLALTLYGIYLLTVRIRVEDSGFTTRSLFGKRVVQFDQVKSAIDRVTGSHRTLDVKTHSGKRVLYVTSSFLPDYANLVDLIQYGAQQDSETRDRKGTIKRVTT